jgi:hypothetical protein
MKLWQARNGNLQAKETKIELIKSDDCQNSSILNSTLLFLVLPAAVALSAIG